MPGQSEWPRGELISLLVGLLFDARAGLQLLRAVRSPGSWGGLGSSGAARCLWGAGGGGFGFQERRAPEEAP